MEGSLYFLPNLRTQIGMSRCLCLTLNKAFTQDFFCFPKNTGNGTAESAFLFRYRDRPITILSPSRP